MRWGEDDAHAISHLRALYRGEKGQWDAFLETRFLLQLIVCITNQRDAHRTEVDPARAGVVAVSAALALSL
jgi:hypothetical protein